MSPSRKRGRGPGELARLYDEWGPELYRFAMLLLKNRAEAEDAVQQVFLALAARRPTFESIDRYLISSIRNECYEIVERRARFPEPEPDDEFEFELIPGAVEAPDDRLAVEKALAELPLAQREVVFLKIFTGRTLAEVAELLEESPNTIAARYRYGMEKLRLYFGATGETDDDR